MVMVGCGWNSEVEYGSEVACKGIGSKIEANSNDGSRAGIKDDSEVG